MKRKTVLITGSSRGIGSKTATLYALNGYNVVINYNKSKSTALRLLADLKKLNSNCMAIKADVSNKEEVDAMISEIIKKFDKIDVLVNNAGISQTKLFQDITYEDFNEVVGVNLGGVYNVTNAVVPYMISAKNGNIINISSMWGLVGASCESMYSATKSAVIGLTKSLAKELGPSNIRVNCIAPGVIDTEMNEGYTYSELDKIEEATPLGRVGKAEEVARVVYFLSGENSSFITGEVINVSGGYTM